MIVEVYTCDRCHSEVSHVRVISCKPIGLRRELCADCIDSLRFFLSGRPDPNIETVTRVKIEELEEVYVRGATALDRYAAGASADEMAEHVRDMLSHARRETNGRTLLGIRV